MREEAGIEVNLKGVLKVGHLIGTQKDGSPPLGEARMSVAFYGEPVSLEMAKSLKMVADDESLQAAWFTVAELK